MKLSNVIKLEKGYSFYEQTNRVGKTILICNEFIAAVLGIYTQHQLPNRISLRLSFRNEESKIGWVPVSMKSRSNIIYYPIVNGRLCSQCVLLDHQEDFLRERGMLDRPFYIQIEIDDFTA